VRIGRARLSADHPKTVAYQVNLARVQIARGETADTEASLREALRVRTGRLRPDDWRIAQVQSLLAAVLAARGDLAGAEPLMLAADRVLQPLPGGQARERDANRARLAALYRAAGRPVPAELAR